MSCIELEVIITEPIVLVATSEAPQVGAVTSVNGQSGVVVLDSDDIVEGSTNLYITVAERNKLTGIESGAEVNQTDAEIKTAYENNADTNAFTNAEQLKLSNIEDNAEENNISDVNAALLTQGGTINIHNHGVSYSNLTTDLVGLYVMTGTEVQADQAAAFTKPMTANTVFTFSGIQLNKAFRLRPSGPYTVTLTPPSGYTFVKAKNSEADYTDGKSTYWFLPRSTTEIEYLITDDE